MLFAKTKVFFVINTDLGLFGGRMRELEIARRLAEAVAGEGGRAYFVGG